jgi:UDP-glucose 4-epimerase
MNTILLTGATGFVGSALLAELKNIPDFRVVAAVRSVVCDVSDNIVDVGDIDGRTDFSSVLVGVNVLVHAAARAHVMRDEVADPLAEFRKVNVEGTLNLARQAAVAGVKRFVFISSIGVHGLNSDNPFKETDTEAPHDAYAISKYEAEFGLRKLAAETGLEVVIIRPPLVYGGAAPGNFRSLINLLAKPLPLPFGLVNNKRSMVYVGNLADFIIRCIEHPKAANQTFLVSDGHDVSLSELIRLIRQSMKKPAWLIPVPVSLFQLAGKLTGKMALVDRLVGDLQVDSRKARERLNWTPPYRFEEGIKATVAEFINRNT